MPAFIRLCALTFCLILFSCQNQPLEPAATPAYDIKTSVWTLDLVRTLPGQQAEYLRNIENNWASARNLAREQGAVLSYRALATTPDSARGWDVLLMTEYADSTAWADRETIFQAIFDSDAFSYVQPARPSAELREFVAGDMALRAVAAAP